MKAKQLIDICKNNWPAKAICFGIAIFLYVFFQIKSLGHAEFNVELSVETSNGMVQASPVYNGSNHSRTVKIIAHGMPASLSSLTEEDFEAYIDLDYASKEGKISFPVLLRLSDKAKKITPLQLVVEPKTVSVEVQEEKTAYFDIDVVLKGKVANGYRIKSKTLNPSQIRITGPHSMIDGRNIIVQTDEIDITNVSRNIVHSVPVNVKGKLLKHEKINTTVTIEVEEVRSTKVFANIPVVLKNLDETLVASDVAPLSIEMEGSVNDLEKALPNSFILFADCSKIHKEGTYEIELSLQGPSSLNLTEPMKKISVTFNPKPILDENKENEEVKE